MTAESQKSTHMNLKTALLLNFTLIGSLTVSFLDFTSYFASHHCLGWMLIETTVKTCLCLLAIPQCYLLTGADAQSLFSRSHIHLLPTVLESPPRLWKTGRTSEILRGLVRVVSVHAGGGDVRCGMSSSGFRSNGLTLTSPVFEQ